MAREAIAEQDDQQGGTYRLELVSCGKPNCTRCAEGPAHGPYWYRYYRRGGKVVSKYVGKTLPAADAAFLERRGDIGADTARMLSQAPAPSAPERAEQAGRHRSDESALAAAGPPGDIPGQVRAAFRVLVADPGPWTPHGFASIARLRERLPGIPRADLDAALIRMYENQEINLVPQSNQMRLTEAERAAAVRCGGQDKHHLSFPHDPEDAVTASAR